jgi:small-conductance mechanosensitive channel
MGTLERMQIWIPIAALVVGVVATVLLRVIALRYAERRGSRAARSLATRTTGPLLVVLPIFLTRLVHWLTELEPAANPNVQHAATLLLLVGFAWLAIALIGVLEAYLRERLLAGVRDDVRAMRVLTRVTILGRALTVVIIVLTAAGVLVTFPEGRAIGTSILASAGIVGVLLGVAARPAAENLIAGLQVAFTEPFRLEDVVIVEGEWGRIEEITATYVIVRVWDLRRLVIPLRYFIEKPFQNWTRSGADLLAQVTLELDYSTPVDELRRRVGEIVASSEHWDGGSWSVQVVEAGERTMRVRVLASAHDSSRAWDMRCEIRERLIAYLQKNHPDALPRIRASLEGVASARAL